MRGWQCGRVTRGSVSPFPGGRRGAGGRAASAVPAPAPGLLTCPSSPRSRWHRRGGVGTMGTGSRGCHPAAVTGRFPASCSRGRGTGLAPLLGRCGAVLSSIPAAVPGMHFPGGFSQLGLAEGSLTSLLLAGLPVVGGMLWKRGMLRRAWCSSCCSRDGVVRVCGVLQPRAPRNTRFLGSLAVQELLRLSITLVPRGDSGDRDVVLCLCPN